MEKRKTKIKDFVESLPSDTQLLPTVTFGGASDDPTINDLGCVNRSTLCSDTINSVSCINYGENCKGGKNSHGCENMPDPGIQPVINPACTNRLCVETP